MIDTHLHITIKDGGVVIDQPTSFDVGHWAVGQAVDTVIETLPRIFNLCRSAQVLGLRRALGLTDDATSNDALRAEIINDHRFKLMFEWPRLFGLPMAQGDTPPDGSDLIAALLARAPELDGIVFSADAMRGLMPARVFPNSAQFCFADIITARATELRLLTKGADLTLRERGSFHIIPASRGDYWLRAAALGGVVTEFERHPPTDTMLAKAGLIPQLLAQLNEPHIPTIEIALAIIDPCYSVKISEGVAHA